jgi:hypothetical protein
VVVGAEHKRQLSQQAGVRLHKIWPSRARSCVALAAAVSRRGCQLNQQALSGLPCRRVCHLAHSRFHFEQHTDSSLPVFERVMALAPKYSTTKSASQSIDRTDGRIVTDRWTQTGTRLLASARVRCVTQSTKTQDLQLNTQAHWQDKIPENFSHPARASSFDPCIRPVSQHASSLAWPIFIGAQYWPG